MIVELLVDVDPVLLQGRGSAEHVVIVWVKTNLPHVTVFGGIGDRCLVWTKDRKLEVDRAPRPPVEGNIDNLRLWGGEGRLNHCEGWRGGEPL